MTYDNPPDGPGSVSVATTRRRAVAVVPALRPQEPGPGRGAGRRRAAATAIRRCPGSSTPTTTPSPRSPSRPHPAGARRPVGALVRAVPDGQPGARAAGRRDWPARSSWSRSTSTSRPSSAAVRRAGHPDPDGAASRPGDGPAGGRRAPRRPAGLGAEGDQGMNVLLARRLPVVPGGSVFGVHAVAVRRSRPWPILSLSQYQRQAARRLRPVPARAGP